MLTKLFSPTPRGDYRAVLKRRRALFILCILLGAATMAVFIALKLAGAPLADYVLGYYTGSGCGVLAIGIFGIFCINRTLKDEARLRADQIKETDERTKEVSRHAASLTGVLVILCGYVALLVAVVVNRTVFYTLLGALGVYILILLCCNSYYGKKL